ncbi:MAG: hypothetical protein PUD02_04040 [Eggerthellales bacterium]|nr:hypothetical protein [Eggerthellales bacterium]
MNPNLKSVRVLSQVALVVTLVSLLFGGLFLDCLAAIIIIVAMIKFKPVFVRRNDDPEAFYTWRHVRRTIIFTLLAAILNGISSYMFMNDPVYMNMLAELTGTSSGSGQSVGTAPVESFF